MDESDWHRKFILIPRRLGGIWVWLAWIEIRVSPIRPFEEQQRLLPQADSKREEWSVTVSG